MSNFQWNPRLYNDAIRAAGRGLEAATVFLETAIKETLSVPAPRVLLTDRKGGRYYVAGYQTYDPATAKAFFLWPGAPPRKLQPSPYMQGAKVRWASSFVFPKGGHGAPNKIRVHYQSAPAIKGDPPRKLSGKLRSSITHEMLEPMKLFEGGEQPTKGRVGVYGPPGGKVGKYAKRLEFGPGGHGFILRTANKFRAQIERIVDGAI
jgi:hypothetical protein